MRDRSVVVAQSLGFGSTIVHVPWAAATRRPSLVTSTRTTADATIVTMTRRSAIIRVDVTNEGRLVAAAQGTCTIVDPKAVD